MRAPALGRNWQDYTLGLAAVVPLLILLCLPPLHQDQHYHQFADRRSFLGIPNFADVVSNIPFLLVGVSGIVLGSRGRLTGYSISWLVFFVGVSIVSLGSGYYHWRPNNDTLVWDRLPMTVGFMGLFVAVLSESVHHKLSILLVPALVLGVLSVVYWHYSDDLRLYAWIQYAPLLIVPIVMVLFSSQYSGRGMLLVALGCYVLAKLFETYDREVFSVLHGSLAGHTIKHLWAAGGCAVILEMLRMRKALQPKTCCLTVRSSQRPTGPKIRFQ